MYIELGNHCYISICILYLIVKEEVRNMPELTLNIWLRGSKKYLPELNLKIVITVQKFISATSR